MQRLTDLNDAPSQFPFDDHMTSMAQFPGDLEIDRLPDPLSLPPLNFDFDNQNAFEEDHLFREEIEQMYSVIPTEKNNTQSSDSEGDIQRRESSTNIDSHFLNEDGLHEEERKFYSGELLIDSSVNYQDPIMSVGRGN